MRFFKTKSHGCRNGAALMLAVFSLTACDGLFDVENPGSLVDEDLETPFLENTLATSAEGELVDDYSSALVNGEMLGDHVWHPSVQDFALLTDAGYRDRDNTLVESMFNGLASAIWVADNMVTRLQAMVANPGAHLGVANSHFMAGLARLTLATYYENVVYDGGGLLPPSRAIEDAIGNMQSAAQVASAAGDINLAAASLGAAARGSRALYYEGGGTNASLIQQAEALARQALDLAPDFRKDMRYGQPGASNGHFTGLSEEGPYHRMHVTYANRPDPVSGVPDPRIIHSAQPESTPGPRGEIRWIQRKYTARTDPLPASRAAEAELIVAEARLIAGDLDGAVQWINRVRAKSGLPDFASSDAAAIRTQLIYERDTELWLEGRRWEDHRYYNIIPVAWDQVNIDRGVSARWPISVQERFNNPNVAGGGG